MAVQHRDAAGGRGTGTWHGDMGCPPCAARRPGAEARVVSSSWTWAMPHCRAMPAPLSAVSSPGKSTSHGSTRHCPIRHAPTAFATVPVVQTVYYGTCSTCCVWCSRNLICNQLWGGGGCQDGAVGMRSPRCCSPKGCGVLGTGHEPPALPMSPSIAHHGAGTAHSVAPLSPSPKPPHPTAVTPSCCRSCSHLRLSGRTVAPELICPGRSPAGCLNGWALGCWGPTGTVPHWGRFPQQPLQHLPRV